MAFKYKISPVAQELENKLEFRVVMACRDIFTNTRYLYLTPEQFGRQVDNRFGNHVSKRAPMSLKDLIAAWYEDMVKNNPVPALEYGTPATEFYYSDRRACTVVAVEYYKNNPKQPKKVVVRWNEVECLDYFAGDYKILPTLVGGDRTYTFRRGKYTNRWIQADHDFKDGVALLIGTHYHYIDPSF